MPRPPSQAPLPFWTPPSSRRPRGSQRLNYKGTSGPLRLARPHCSHSLSHQLLEPGGVHVCLTFLSTSGAKDTSKSCDPAPGATGPRTDAIRRRVFDSRLWRLPQEELVAEFALGPAYPSSGSLLNRGCSGSLEHAQNRQGWRLPKQPSLNVGGTCLRESLCHGVSCDAHWPQGDELQGGPD